MYVVPKPPPQRGLKNATCPKFKQQSAIASKRYEIGCQLVLIANIKSHTDFALVHRSLTLNDLKRCNSPYFCVILPNSIALQTITSQCLKIDLCPQNIFSQLHLAKTDPRSSRTVSLRQLSFLLHLRSGIHGELSYTPGVSAETDASRGYRVVRNT